MAHPALNRPPAVEAELAGKYIAALKEGPIRKALFAQRPRLVTLAATRQAASAEWTELQFQKRLTRREPDAEHEDMEMGVTETIRETLAHQNQTIKALEEKITALTTAQSKPQKPAPVTEPVTHAQPPFRRGTRPPINPDGSAGACFYCRRVGHMAKACRKKKWDMQHRNRRPHPLEGQSVASPTPGN